jgi:hypothetical protein
MFILTPEAAVRGLLILIIYILACRPVGWLIGTLTARWQEHLPDNGASLGLPGGGMWIGCMERIAIITLILADMSGTIGFLIAAKSILRFPEITARDENGSRMRAAAEYVIIGTLMSFIGGLGGGLLAREILTIRMPWC